MALKRSFLKGMGLTDEQCDSIIEAHAETVDGLKADLARYKESAGKAEQDRKSTRLNSSHSGQSRMPSSA